MSRGVATSYEAGTPRLIWGLVLIAPALAAISLLYLWPLGRSIVTAFTGETGPTLAHLDKALTLYGRDVLFSIGVAAAVLALVALFSVAIGGYLVLGQSRWAVAALRWLYRWPLFIPMIVAAQAARSFLSQNGMLNGLLGDLGLVTAETAASLLDWRGLVLTLTWKLTPFAALLVSGAMAALHPSTIESARNLGAGRLTVLIRIILPQILPTLAVALILCLVQVFSVLSVPMMLVAGSPNMMTTMMAHRVTYYGDYAVANALGLTSYAITALAAILYLRLTLRARA